GGDRVQLHGSAARTTIRRQRFPGFPTAQEHALSGAARVKYVGMQTWPHQRHQDQTPASEEVVCRPLAHQRVGMCGSPCRTSYSYDSSWVFPFPAPASADIGVGWRPFLEEEERAIANGNSIVRSVHVGGAGGKGYGGINASIGKRSDHGSLGEAKRRMVG